MHPTGTECAPMAAKRRSGPPRERHALRWRRENLLLVVGLALVAALGWSYAPDLSEFVARWRGDPSYSHGFLVPLFAGLLLWLRREQNPGLVWQPNLWGLLC